MSKFKFCKEPLNWYLGILGFIITFGCLELVRNTLVSNLKSSWDVWISGIVSLIVAVTVPFVLRGLFKEIAKNITEIYSKEISHVKNAEYRFKLLPNYAKALVEVSRNFRYQETLDFRNQVINDHKELLESEKYLLSFSGYLSLLKELSEKYSEMFCVNRTLPVEWYAPTTTGNLTDADNRRVNDYRNHLKSRMKNGFNLKRITIAKKIELKQQIFRAYNEIPKLEDDSPDRIKWFLKFVQVIFETRENDIQSRASDEISKFFGAISQRVNNAIFSNIVNSLDDVFEDQELVLKAGAKDFEAKYVEPMIISKEDHSEIKGFWDDLHGVLISKFLLDTTKDEMRKDLVEGKVEELSAFYLGGKVWKEINEKHEFGGRDFGEIGVYINNTGEADFAIATIGGEIGNSICIEIIEPGKIYEIIKNSIEKTSDRENSPVCGNLHSLYDKSKYIGKSKKIMEKDLK